MLRRWVVAACARECGNALIRSDFEVLQRAVLPAFAPLLRKHPGDPKCETTELCFLLRAGWVVVRPIRIFLATYSPIPAVFFSFSLLLSTSGRALVMLGPGAAHGCPPLSGACHRGAHQQKKTGGDPKSHVGAPGHYCSRGARRGVFFLLLPDAGALMGRRALGVASRGGAHPKWPL